MEDSDEQIDALETEFPALSAQAFSQAAKEARQHGFTTLFTREGQLYRRLPNGKVEWVKEIDPPVDVAVGTKIKIR